MRIWNKREMRLTFEATVCPFSHLLPDPTVLGCRTARHVAVAGSCLLDFTIMKAVGRAVSADGDFCPLRVTARSDGEIHNESKVTT